MPPKAITKSGSNQVIDLTKKVSITMNESAPFHEKGEKVSVHPNIAKLFEKRGFGTIDKNQDTNPGAKAEGEDGQEGGDE